MRLRYASLTATVYCLSSNRVEVSLTPAEFEKLRGEIGRQLHNALKDWVSIAVKCNIYELHCYFETRGAEAVL